jgi:hypothetical protein
MLTFDRHELDAALAGRCHGDHAVSLTIHGDGSMAGVVHLGVTRPRPVLSLRAMHVVLAGSYRCWLTVWRILGNGTCAARLRKVHAWSTDLCADHVRRWSWSCERNHWEVDSSSSSGRCRYSGLGCDYL